MGGFSVKTQGFAELDAKLEELARLGGGPGAIVRDGLRAGGEVIQVAIAERAPERPDLPSGTALPVGALKRDVEVHIGVEDGLQAAIVRPGTETAWAANLVEFGHRIVKGGYSKALPGGKHRGPGKQLKDETGELIDVPAYPFIRPGFEASEAEAVEVFKAKVADGIDKAWKR